MGIELLRAIRALIEVAVGEKWIEPENDPTLSIRLRKPRNQQQRKWPQQIVDRFEAHHGIGTPARTAFALAKALGNRRGDIATVGWDSLVQIEEEDEFGDLVLVDVLDFRQMKNRRRHGGKHMILPVTNTLKAVLTSLTPQPGKTILQRRDGEPYSIKSLTGTMAKWCQQAGIPAGYTLHGLRHSFAHELAKSKVPVTVIKDMLGHDNLATTQTYLTQVNAVESAIEARNAINERDAKRDAAKRRANLRIVG
jgi:integrase